jgi:hypothetical protein
MGIIGGVLSLPSAICSGAVAAGVSSLSNGAKSAAAAGDTFMGICIIGGILGLIGGIMGKKSPTLAGIMMIIAVLFVGITAIPTMNLLGVISAILFLIGAAFCFTQKKEEFIGK